jgi:hypothetical protein
MLASLVLGAATLSPAAPVPRDTVPPPAGPAPKVAVLRADAGGALALTGVIDETRKEPVKTTAVENGQVTAAETVRRVGRTTTVRKTLAELAGELSTAGGVRLTPEEAARRVQDGSAVLVSADGKPVAPGWLRAADPDAVVITSPSFAHADFQAPNRAVSRRMRADADVPQGPATPEPRLVLLAADPDGRVTLAVYPTSPAGGTGSSRFVVQQNGGVNNPGVVQLQVVAEVTVTGPEAKPATEKKPLDEVAFNAYTADGALLPRADALARLKAGGLVLVAGDNRLPDQAYRKLFHRDLVVLASAELSQPAATGVSTFRQVPLPVMPAAPGAIQLQPIPAPIAPRNPPAVRVIPRAIGPAPAPAPNAPAPNPPPAKKG